MSHFCWAFAAAPLLASVFVGHAAFAGDCVRPTDAGGFQGYDYGEATVQSFGDERVLVWYVTTGQHSVNPASTRADGVPDDVADVVSVTSAALNSYAAMGYRTPVSDSDASCGSNGGDGRLDVYLVAMTGADGVTIPEDGRCTASGAAQRCAAFVLAKANFKETYPTSAIGIRTVLPHETFHVIQDAYDVGLDRFWAEGTAQWAAKTLDPSLGDLERFLPGYFSDVSHSLDSPANGVTSSFLYGAAIWPVFLTRQEGDGVVLEILEEEGIEGDSAIVSTDAVLATEMTSVAEQFTTFATWNAATGDRAGTGGYPDAAKYPTVDTIELDASEIEQSGASGISSGLDAFYYHAKVSSPVTVELDTDPARNAATLVPLVDGKARLDLAEPLPAQLSDEAIVVVNGITTKKTDAPFTLSLVAAPLSVSSTGGAGGAVSSGSSSAGGGGSDGDNPGGGCDCAVAGGDTSEAGWPFAVALFGLLARARKRFERRSLVLAALFLVCLVGLVSCEHPRPVPSAKKERLVTVGGSVTETVFALGAGDLVVGTDTSSLFPEQATRLPQVGYQRALSTEGVLALEPTEVIVSGDAGPPAAIEGLQAAGVRVEIVSGDPTIDGARERIRRIGELVGRDPAPTLAKLDADLATARAAVAQTSERPRVLTLYARGPGTLYVFGKNTTASAMIELSGATNAVTAFEGSKALTSEAVALAAPDIVLIPSRGLASVGGVDGVLKLPGLSETPAGKARRVVAIDDLLLLGWGPRTGEAALELTRALHPAAGAQP